MTPMQVGQSEREVHISIGIALYPQDATTVALIDIADRALLAVKRAGRNRWSFANESTARSALAERIAATNRAAAER